MGHRRVVITGLGAVTPVGNSAEATWQSLVSGQSGVSGITRFDASDLRTRIAAEVKDFDPVALFGAREARRMDRFTQFALAAALEALDDSGLTINESNAARVGAIIGSGIGGVGTLIEEAYKAVEKGEQWTSPHMVPMILPDTAPGKIAIELGARGPNMSIATACASSTNAIGEAAATIQRGAADVIITGGAEAGILKLVIAGFSNMGALSQRNDEPERASRPFDRDRDGFVAGEGATILILESEEHARARGARIYAEVLGYGASADAYHITAPLENGEGAIIAMKQALATAGIQPSDVDYLNAHGTSTDLNDRSETRAIKHVFGEAAYDLPISSTKSMTGHLMGAAGALEALACVMAIQTNCIPPTINYENPDPELDLDYVPNEARSVDVRIAMSNSFGFGGHNASLVIGRYDG
ncbi:MAG TPA: beta-ketoacyl-ACP synthase II [Aggregatilineales bacterium]|nr:beta-ketoacyl-ACP synthase II [Aggregatilineales bacterium]HQA69667.1 beta-ketoacyl-ACP synthase II [Aggregatilineales bacterium]